MTFCSRAAIESAIAETLGVQRKMVACRNTRSISKADMLLNTWQPKVTVDPQTYEVRADGALLTCEPADVLPLAQLYNLF